MSSASRERASGTAFAVVAGGGTGGHLYPGLAVAADLVAAGRRSSDIHFVVSRRAADMATVAAAGFGATAVHARGLRRKATPANLLAGAVLARGIWQCWRLLGRIAPRVVLAQGGFVSATCALAARLRRIPVVVLEANATAGLANRMAARWAVACAVAFPDTALPRKVVTGLPVREAIGRLHPTAGGELEAAGRAKARAALGADPERRLVLVIGGSQGSARLNSAVGVACGLLADRHDLTMRHVAGHAAATSESPPVSQRHCDGLHYQAVEYEDDMGTALTAADLVVSRAGGSTLAELASVGRASVLVPLPGAAGDHQTANATVLARGGAAEVVSDSELDGERLADVVDELLGDPERLMAMERAAASLGTPGAAGQVADMLRRAAGEERNP